MSSSKGLVKVGFVVDGAIPPSLNHQYGRGGKQTFLKPIVKEYRELVHFALAAKKTQWKPTGVTAAIIIFESPLWITQERLVRQMDADNKVKPLLDAVQEVTDAPDELFWQLHIFKQASVKTRTHIALFDLGDVIGYGVES